MNKHDLKAAQIVAGAMEASKLPPAAAKEVFRAMGAAGAQPPAPEALAPSPTAMDVLGMQERDRLVARRVALQQDGVLLALLREVVGERAQIQSLNDVGSDRLKGYDYLPTETTQGFREYELDGKPIIHFYPPEVALEGGFMLVNLRYRIAT